VRNPARERSRNLNREVWESPSVYGGEDVNVAVEMLTGGVGIGFFLWDEWNRLNLSSVFLAVIVIGVTGLILDYLISRLQVLVTHRPAKPGS
jgi:nitrate/nitrite transport system permease protein